MLVGKGAELCWQVQAESNAVRASKMPAELMRVIIGTTSRGTGAASTSA
ncbi:hypothetical protein [Lentzea tibetensis]|nr:hypothetical protein [Lentzea tibetensis]